MYSTRRSDLRHSAVARLTRTIRGRDCGVYQVSIHHSRIDFTAIMTPSIVLYYAKHWSGTVVAAVASYSTCTLREVCERDETPRQMIGSLDLY